MTGVDAPQAAGLAGGRIARDARARTDRQVAMTRDRRDVASSHAARSISSALKE